MQLEIDALAVRFATARRSERQNAAGARSSFGSVG